jgi:hypothetical protein
MQGPVFGANDEATVVTFEQLPDQQYDQEYWDSVGYYDEAGNFIYYEQQQEQEDFLSEGVAEEYELFLSEWNPLPSPTVADEDAMSLSVWPECDFTVRLRRLDVYQSYAPKAQQASTDPKESLRMRRTPGWAPFRSIYFLNQPVHMTKEVLIETGSGPTRRQRFRPHDRSNRRDTSTWVKRETIHGFVDTMGIPGSLAVYVDHVDTPDRYFISTSPFPSPSCRRMFRLAGYPATQYFILGREVEHPSLEAEGGRGTTYILQSGSYVTSRKHWRLISSFWAFDAPLRCTNKYTVYQRNDPFPRMVIALDTFDRIDEWTPTHTFYAWDVCIPGTRGYTLQHIIPSIYSTATHFRRHRLCTVYPSLPWEFRMKIFVFPADLSDCTVDLDGSIAEIVHAAV